MHVSTEVQRPAVRLCTAADVERYSRFTDLQASRAQERFTSALRKARVNAGLAESEVDLQASGDGEFAVLPPGIDETEVIPRFVAELTIALREVNADLSDHARLRLRVAMHRGLLAPGVCGWVGTSAIAVHRLLDSPAARSALAEHPDADFALIVGDTLYRDVIAHGHRGLSAGSFREVVVEIPAKRFSEVAWVHLGRSW
ncbi:hypothetical protein FKR81_34540 [Lentzea tibetensis]|uniref:Guanylate cyclase domain-containing protein n=1 Tax=Lentzea tibetensis TaxID=2591470 RepID=A0A563EJ04_9PSEU|nr:hypothetical protein [Lentzea tibetensis]TWP46709.1 hypothetical protein FKR81_34540 [Lentzea tibetensis]